MISHYNNFLNKVRNEIISINYKLICCKNSFTLAISRQYNQNLAKINLPRSLYSKLNHVVDKFPLEVKNNLHYIKSNSNSNINKILFPLVHRKHYFNFFKTQIIPTLSTNSSHHIHCIKSFLQGLFLGFGYIQDITKSYHLEINFSSKFHFIIFKHINNHLKMGFKFIKRQKSIISYLKNANKIGKFFTLLETFDSLMYLKDHIETKKITNSINRKVNYETSNIKKSIDAASNQIEKINKILELIKLDDLSPALQQIIHMRLKYPYDTLEQLAKRFSPPLSKSAVNHRIRRIYELYDKILSQNIK